MVEWIVPFEDRGKKLIVFLTERLSPHYSSRALKRVLEMNQCQVNGRMERFASTILGERDHVVLHLEKFAEKKEDSKQFDLARILYEDEDLLIYNKPPDLTCEERGILSLLKKYHSSLHLIHRLDRHTTGVLLLAKNQTVYESMVQLFREHSVEKCYVAIVDGILEKGEGVIDNYLGKKHAYAGQTVWGSVKKEKGLHAHTKWKKIREGKKVSLVFCFPITGRTHQIRVHMSGIGHPILGDFQYCKKFQSSYTPSRYLLHAYQMRFPHPRDGQKIEVQAPLPEDFTQAQQELFGTKKL